MASSAFVSRLETRNSSSRLAVGSPGHWGIKGPFFSQYVAVAVPSLMERAYVPVFHPLSVAFGRSNSREMLRPLRLESFCAHMMPFRLRCSFQFRGFVSLLALVPIRVVYVAPLFQGMICLLGECLPDDYSLSFLAFPPCLVMGLLSFCASARGLVNYIHVLRCLYLFLRASVSFSSRGFDSPLCPFLPNPFSTFPIALSVLFLVSFRAAS